MSYEVLKNLGISIGIFFLFLLFRKLFTKYVFRLMLKLGQKTPTELFTSMTVAFEQPIRWLFIIIGIYVAADYFPFMEQSSPLFLKIIRASIIMLIAWGLYNLSSGSSLLFMKINDRFNMEIDQILILFFSKAIRFIIVAISLSIIAQVFEYDVNGFIAGLGLCGLAFALAAKDAIGNLFGGIIIITEKPFTIGDWIKTRVSRGRLRIFPSEARESAPSLRPLSRFRMQFQQMNQSQIGARWGKDKLPSNLVLHMTRRE